MGQPVKLSDELVLDARIVGQVAERSIAGQIEYWAGLGRAIEPLLRTETAIALKKSGQAKALSEIIDSVGTSEGKARFEAHLASLPYPHFEAAETPGFVVRVEEDGTRTVGRFINRVFRPKKGK